MSLSAPATVAPSTSPTPAWVSTMLLSFVAAVEAGVVVFVSVVVGIVHESCGVPATSEVVRTGELALAGVAICAMAPWLLACLWSRRRLRLVVLAVVAALPALVLLATSTRPEDWTGCLIQF